MPLSSFPERPDLIGIGLSDYSFAEGLSTKLGYRNTFYDQEPQLDIGDPPAELDGTLDFLIASEVIEHVPPPVERAFESAFRLLKPGGLLILTVPYSLDGETREHFPTLHQYEIFDFGGSPILVNRTVDGRLEVFEDLVFHGGEGATLEMRAFARDSLLQQFRSAGFEEITERRDQRPEFGIFWGETEPSAPMMARRPR